MALGFRQVWNCGSRVKLGGSFASLASRQAVPASALFTLHSSLFTLYCLLFTSLAVASDDVEPVPYFDTINLEPAAAQIINAAQETFAWQQQELDGPMLGNAYGRLGMVYQAWQFQELARATYWNARQLDPDDYRWPYYLAVYYEEAGEFDSAINHYRKSLALKSDYANSWLRLAEVSLEAAAVDDAEQAYLEALNLDQEMAAAIAGLGTVAMRREQYDVAIDRFESALKLQPEASQLHYRLALAYRHTGDLGRARAHLEKRGERIPSQPDPVIELMKARTKPSSHFSDAARQAFEKGNYQRAISGYRLAVDIDPTNVSAYVGAARLYLEIDRPEQARQLLGRALELEPDNATALELEAELDNSD